MNVLYQERQVEGLQAPAIKGDSTVGHAVDQLLSGTNLRATKVDDNTISVAPMPATGDREPTSNVRESQTQHAASVPDARVGLDATARGERAPETLAEVVVTAQKREERLIDVPISMAALNGEALQQRGVVSILDLPSVVPGLAIYDSGTDRSFEIRGISNFAGSSSALVGLYLDEADVTVGRGTAIDVSSIYDLERIEVLRGPQGTLYGEGSAGGTIRFITRRPDLNRFAADSDVTVSFTESGSPSEQIDSMLNIPLVSNVFGVRLVGTFRRDGGWIDQPAADAKDVNGSDTSGLRVKGLWKPNSQIKISAMADISRSDRGPGTGEDAMGNFTQAFDFTTTPRSQVDHDLYNLTVAYDFESVEILNTATYLKETNTSRDVASYLPVEPPTPPFQAYIPRVSINERVWIDEFRVTSTGSARWKWTAGVFHRHDKSGLNEPHYYFGPPGPFTPDEDGGAYISTGLSSSWSAFGDASYRLIDRLTVGAGVRYFRDSQESNNNFQESAQQGTFHSVDPRAYIKFNLAEGANLYASAAKGFRSGGFNFPAPSTPPTYAPEHIWTYELGTKMSLLAGRLGVDAAVFYTNYSDYQSLGVSAQLGGPPGFYNGGNARIKGAEFDMSWRPTNSWQLGLNGDYLRDQFTTINLTQTAHNVGDELDFVPKYQLTASLQRDFEWMGRIGFARLDYSQQGPQVLRNRALGPIFFGKSDTIRLLSFRTGLTLSDSLKLNFFAQNLLNDRGFLNPDYIEGYSPRSRPRTYGIEFGAAFD